MAVAKKTEMCICVYVCMHEALMDLVKPYTEWALQNPKEHCIHTHTYIHMHISFLFPTDMGVLHKVLIEMGLCNASKGFTNPSRGFAMALQSPFREGALQVP